MRKKSSTKKGWQIKGRDKEGTTQVLFSIYRTKVVVYWDVEANKRDKRDDGLLMGKERSSGTDNELYHA